MNVVPRGIFVRSPSMAAARFRPAALGVARPFTATRVSQQAPQDLASQKKNRPLTPELMIYEPQLTWYMSTFHRISGVYLSGAFYAAFAAYAAAPMVGYGFTSGDAVAAFASLPVAAKVGTKFLLAYPFTYHSANGVRHLVWDTARSLTMKGVYTSGYTVLAVSTLSAGALAIM